MMVRTTVKAKVVGKSESGEDASRYAQLTFAPDYADGRNKEWALATPHFNCTMTVKGDVGDQFEYGKCYTLIFEESTEEVDTAV